MLIYLTMASLVARRSIKVEILSIVFLSLFLITSSLGYLSFNFSKKRLATMLGDSIKGVAATTANFINWQDLLLIQANTEGIKEKYRALKDLAFAHIYGERLKASGEEEDPSLIQAVTAYAKYAELLSSVKKMNNIDSPINVYMKDGTRVRLILTSDNAMLTGVKYSIRPEARTAFSTGEPQATGIYKDKDGSWISAYSPLPPSQTDLQAIVEINTRIDSYIDRLNSELAAILVVCLLGFFGTAALSYRFVDKVSSAVIKLDELKASLAREKKAHLESILALTNVLGLKDPYTKHHLYRVESYALLIAKEMRLTSREKEILRYGCHLHDIGKIGVDPDVLQKVKLTKEDFEQIKKHTETGAKMVEGIKFLAEVQEIILHHQERYDGKGYPKGLSGERIPLLARIVAVADAFDAMTTDRPYKSKVGFKEAFETIEEASGTQFDPRVCKALLKYRNKLENIAARHFERF